MIMKRSTLIFVSIILIIVSILAIMFLPNPSRTESYPLSTTVIKINTTNDIVVVEDFNGNVWEFYGCEDWKVGDICAMIMDDCGTVEIYDDKIVTVKYCGEAN